MYLMYIDESGSTGTDYNNEQQPVFSLAGICVEDCKWHAINNKFEQEKIKIYPEFKNYEIHATELFNASKKSPFKKYSWQQNLKALEKIVDLITSLDITLYNTTLDKQGFKKHISSKFCNSIKLDPYLYAFGNMYYSFNENLSFLDSYGIVFTDELQSVSDGLELLYPKLKEDNPQIIEKSLYLDSKKNNFIQIADVCALYFNKSRCIREQYHTYNDIKTQHCLNMQQKLLSKITTLPTFIRPHTLDDIDNLFK